MQWRAGGSPTEGSPERQKACVFSMGEPQVVILHAILEVEFQKARVFSMGEPRAMEQVVNRLNEYPLIWEYELKLLDTCLWKNCTSAKLRNAGVPRVSGRS